MSGDFAAQLFNRSHWRVDVNCLTRPTPGKHELALAHGSLLFENRHRRLVQRHAMLPPGLHPLAGNRPQTCGHIDLVPPRSDNLTRARRR